MLSEGFTVLLSRHGASHATRPESFGLGRTFTDWTCVLGWTRLQSNHNYKDAQRFLPVLASVADKINLAFGYKEERRFDRVQKRLIEEFFKRGLATSQAWNVIAKYSAQFLPDFAPFEIHPQPLSQILTYKPGDRHLVMRASQSGDPITAAYNERVAIPLKVDETICGIPIENNLEFLLTNPANEYPGRYQAYLYQERLAKSELVFTIRDSNEIIAVINIEHPDEGVFTEYCVESIRRATRSLSPFVKAVIEREEQQRRKEISLMYVMTEILRRMASIYRHKIGQLLLKSRIIIDKLSKAYAHDDSMQTDLAYLRHFISDFDDKSKAFLTELPNYIKYQHIGIIFVINQALKELDAEVLEQEKGDKIKIELSYPGKEIYVYASQLLKEHIYNLINPNVA